MSLVLSDGKRTAGRFAWADGATYEGEFADGAPGGTGPGPPRRARAHTNGLYHFSHKFSPSRRVFCLEATRAYTRGDAGISFWLSGSLCRSPTRARAYTHTHTHTHTHTLHH